MIRVSHQRKDQSNSLGPAAKFVERANTQLGFAQQNLISAIGQAQVAAVNLANVLGLPMNTIVLASDPVIAAGRWTHSAAHLTWP